MRSSLQIAAVENEIAALERDRARETAQVLRLYSARIGNAPRLQPKFLELTRDADQAKLQLDLAAVQNERAQHLQDLEESKTGDQFQIQDRASPPAAPFKPNVFDVGHRRDRTRNRPRRGSGAPPGSSSTRACGARTSSRRVFPDLAVYGVIPSLDAGPKSRGLA